MVLPPVLEHLHRLGHGLPEEAGGVAATGVALRLISRVVAKARTPTRPMTRRVRRIVLGVIQRCSRPLARDIIVVAAERPTCMAAPTGRSLAGYSMSRRILRLT